MALDRPTTYQGFKVVGIKFSEESKGIHQVLWKKHSVREYNERKPNDRTLFVVNIPPYCTESAIRRIFREYGPIKEVFLHKRPTSSIPPHIAHPHFSSVQPVQGFKVAYVVFKDVSAIKNAMAVPPSTVLVASTEEKPVLTGIKKWKQEYNKSFVEISKLSKEIGEVIAEYDKKSEAERLAAKEEPDADGWVTVTSSRRKRPRMVKADVVENKKKKRKKKKQMLVSFYSFQQKQTKMDHLADLRKKFEEDKKRINVMKASRKFRPY